MSDSTAKYWQGIIEGLDALLSTLKENFVCETRFYSVLLSPLNVKRFLLSLFLLQVPLVLIHKILSQAFSLINVQLWNRFVFTFLCFWNMNLYGKQILIDLF